MAIITKTDLLVCKRHKKCYSEKLLIIANTIAQGGGKKTDCQLYIVTFCKFHIPTGIKASESKMHDRFAAVKQLSKTYHAKNVKR